MTGETLARDIYAKTKLSSFYTALEIMEELRSDPRIEENLIPGVIYEAGRQRKKDATNELHKAAAIIQASAHADRSQAALQKAATEIREAAKAGGYEDDPVRVLYSETLSVLLHLVALNDVIL